MFYSTLLSPNIVSVPSQIQQSNLFCLSIDEMSIYIIFTVITVLDSRGNTGSSTTT